MRTISAALVAFGLLINLCGAGRAEDKAEAQKIIDKAIKASGGEENLKKWKSLTWKSKGNIHIAGNPAPFTGEWAMTWPEKSRMSVDLDLGGQKFTFMLVYNSGKGWQSMNGNTEELAQDRLDEQKENAYAGGVARLLPLKDKAYTLSVVGETKVDNKPVVGVKVSSKGHRDVTLYFDKATSLLAKTETNVKDETGTEVKQETLFSDYKDVDGVKQPLKVTIKRDGMPYVEVENSDFKRADKLDEKLFEKP
jgi:hypothetical protein